MFKKMNEKMKKRKGFTLVELVVVIAILGILAAVAVPRLSGSRVKAANAAHNANVRTLESAATMFIADKGAQGVTWTGEVRPDTGAEIKHDWDTYLQKWPKLPAGAEITVETPAVTAYTVEIGADGKITVKPGAIVETP